VEEQPITELPRRLHQRPPRALVADPRREQTPLFLELPQRGLRVRAKKTRLGILRREPGGTEAALQVADGFAPLTRD
jgi:hypothetical protein